MDNIDTSRIEAVLRYRIPSIKILWTEETGSTNSDLLELAQQGESGWTVLGADWQTGGHGRHRRHWASPAGGLYLSTLLKLEKNESPITLIPLAVGLALAEALLTEAESRGGHIKPWLKWPNDILTARGKLAGVLCESMENDDQWLIVAGIGVNILPLDEETRRLIVDPVTSLKEEAEVDWTRAGLVTSYLLKLKERIEDWKSDPEKVRSDWFAASGALGHEVRVKTPSGTVEGTVRGLSESGALQLLRKDGIPFEITSSESIEEHHG